MINGWLVTLQVQLLGVVVGEPGNQSATSGRVTF